MLPSWIQLAFMITKRSTPRFSKTIVLKLLELLQRTTNFLPKTDKKPRNRVNLFQERVPLLRAKVKANLKQ